MKKNVCHNEDKNVFRMPFNLLLVFKELASGSLHLISASETTLKIGHAHDRFIPNPDKFAAITVSNFILIGCSEMCGGYIRIKA